jgi:hypothetical protein
MSHFIVAAAPATPENPVTKGTAGAKFVSRPSK